jgi:integrase
MRTLSAEQARALLQFAQGDRLEALYHVALASGARQGELLALRWTDVDLESGKIRIQRSLTRTANGLEMGETKTESSRRTVPIGAAAKALKAHRIRQTEERFQARERWNDNGLVFADEVGKPLDGVKVTRSSFYSALRRASLPTVRFHDLRHTAATLMLENGVHPRVVAERLGHSTPSLVMNIYGHVTERMQDKATAAMDAALYS